MKSDSKTPILPIEQEIVEFLSGMRVQWPPFERGLIDTLSKAQQISVKQRVALWRIPGKFNFPPDLVFPHADTVMLISLLIDALDSVHKGYWADKQADEMKEVILTTMRQLTKKRADWINTKLMDAC